MNPPKGINRLIEWKLQDSYGMGFFIYFIKTLVLYGLLFAILLFVFMAVRNSPFLLLLWMAVGMFFHFFGQFAYGLPVYYLLKDAGYPKVAKGFIWSSIVPLILISFICIYLIYNYQWENIYSPDRWI